MGLLSWLDSLLGPSTRPPPPGEIEMPGGLTIRLEPFEGDGGSGYSLVRDSDDQRLNWQTLKTDEGLKSFYVMGAKRRMDALQSSAFRPGQAAVVRPSPLAEVAADPDRLEERSREELPYLLAELERLRAKMWARLSRPPQYEGATPPSDSEDPAQLLDVEAVAEILDVDPRYVYDHADDWPFTRRISPRKLRFSEQGLYRWLETRPWPPLPATAAKYRFYAGEEGSV